MQNLFFLSTIILVASLSSCQSTTNQTQPNNSNTSMEPKASLENAKPLGFILGQTSYQEIQKSLSEKDNVNLNPRESDFFGSIDNSILVSTNTNHKITAAGNGLGIENLDIAKFIFDDSDNLSGVILKLPEREFQSISNLIESKYPNIIERQIPHVGDKFVKIEVGNSLIFIEDPHMGGFSMTVTYVTKTSLDNAIQKSKTEKQEIQNKTQQQL
jgi:hypothetical protein